MTTMTEHLFDADTAVHADGDALYRAELTDRWTALGGTPNGGYMLAVALRALQADMPLPDPLVTSAHFLRPGASAPPRSAPRSSAPAGAWPPARPRLIQDGREIVRLLATFGDLAQAGGRTLVLNEPARAAAARRDARTC